MKLKWSYIQKGLFIIIPLFLIGMIADYYINTSKHLQYSLTTNEMNGHIDRYIHEEVEYGDDKSFRLDDTLTSIECIDLVIKLNKSIK